MEEFNRTNPSIGRRIGYFFLALLPTLTCIVAQFVVAFVVVLIVTISTALRVGNVGFEYDILVNQALEKANTYSTLGYHILGLFIFWLWYYLITRKMHSPYPKVKGLTNLKAIIISIFLGVILCLFANGIVCIESYIVPEVVEDYMRMVEQLGMFQDVPSIIAAVCLAPLGEELLCRGVTLHFAKKALPKFWMANVLQAFLFGFIHLNWVQGVYAFVMGLFLGYMRERYHSLIPAMLIHFTINFSSTFWIEKAFGWIPDTLLAEILLFMIPFVLSLVCVYLTKEKKEVNSDNTV